jgi:adenosine deaminase
MITQEFTLKYLRTIGVFWYIVSQQEKTFVMNLNFPKLELHAHLNGSIVHLTMMELIQRFHPELKLEYLSNFTEEHNGKTQPKPHSIDTIHSFFQLFQFIYRLVDSPKAITLATLRICELFWDMNCVYLELRSTPKGDKSEYIKAVIQGIQIFETIYGSPLKLHSQVQHDWVYENEPVLENHKRLQRLSLMREGRLPHCIVRLLVSLDRRHTVDQALQTISTVHLLPVDLQPYVIGFDICGDPTKGNLMNWVPVFDELHRRNYPFTVHLGEVPNCDKEIAFVLDQNPRRVGHATFFNSKAERITKQKRICVELCISSNLLCK